MYTRRLTESPTHRRGGQISYLLFTEGEAASNHLSITWVEGATGSEQALHSHPDSEQVYVVIAGRGLMRVAGEEQEVKPGTLIFIPKGADHAIRNIGTDRLTYVSATSPPFDPALVAGLYEPPPAPAN